MKRRILSLVLVFVLCVLLAQTAYATQSGSFVADDAGLLTSGEAAALDERLQEISQKYNAQVTVITIEALEEGDVDGYIEAVYDQLGLGYGENKDGVLLLVCMDPREYRILSNGFAAEAITLSDIENMGDAFVSDLSDGDYADAFDTFADDCEYYLDGYINGFPFDAGMTLLVAVVIGFVIALIVTGIWKGQLKSVRKRNEATAYVKAGSMQLTQSGDYFLYRTVTKTEKPQSSASSGGGSSRNVGGGSF